MRNPNRIPEFCNQLAAIWSKYPDWRFGQLIENFKRFVNKSDLFYIEDEDFMKMLKGVFENGKE